MGHFPADRHLDTGILCSIDDFLQSPVHRRMMGNIVVCHHFVSPVGCQHILDKIIGSDGKKICFPGKFINGFNN